MKQEGGGAIPKINKRLLPLLIYFSLVTILMLLTMKTNFNLTGYNYYLDEKSMVLTIEEDFVKKEMFNVKEDSVIQPLKVMLAINKANDMWLLTICILSLFISVFFVLFFKPLRPRKNVELYVVVYILFLTTFIIWDFYIHKEIIEEISNALNGV